MRDSSLLLKCGQCLFGSSPRDFGLLGLSRGFGCNRYREGCDFVVWKEMAGKKLTEKQIQTLIARGKTRLINGFKSRKGSKFDACLKLDENGKTIFDFAD